MYSTYLLVSHGSHDPRPQQALKQLADRLKNRINLRLLPSSPSPVLATATLECSPVPLHEQIKQYAEYTRNLGLNQLEILPLFLLPGVHVKEDIPQEVAIAQEALGQAVSLKIKPYLGYQLSRLATKLTYQMTSIPCEVWILLSHGSRRPLGNQPVEELASQLGAIPAYWSISPSLESQIEALVKTGYKNIGILPYFIFAGGITDAIARLSEELAEKYQSVKFRVAEPLGVNDTLVDLVVDILMEN
ncbi:MAG: sirohydrochlorin chelatase [Limnoraphis robusta]|uniref:Cobalamin biosynthesis protein CbiX n=1 Tax=Limnoraphis robusta CS-951 TaxID=1637645 RepID=A0A0F5Y958_9CYAN|nr:sirohydrochlorin chelatase [Limnoraphis robusta]KKD35404.1 cobalamin biosynthesis protein CbiX [Limnoraphis robusta CS-951]